MMSLASRKHCLISLEGTDKNPLEPGRESMGDGPVLSHILCQEILDQNQLVCCSIVVKEKLTVCSPFFGSFPSDHIPKAIPVNYTSKFQEHFEASA